MNLGAIPAPSEAGGPAPRAQGPAPAAEDGAVVNPETGEILPVDHPALAGLSPEDRAALEAIAARPELPPSPVADADVAPPRRVRPISPDEYARLKRPDDLDNEGRPFESRDQAFTVLRARNLAGYQPARVKRKRVQWRSVEGGGRERRAAGGVSRDVGRL